MATNTDVIKRIIKLLENHGTHKTIEILDELEKRINCDINPNAEIIIKAICNVFNISRNKLILSNKSIRRTPNESDAQFYCIWFFIADGTFTRHDISMELNITESNWDNFYRKQKTYNPNVLNDKIPLHRSLIDKINTIKAIINQNK